MDRKIVRQAVIDLGGSATGRQVADKLNIRYELAMHHLSSLHKSEEMKLDNEKVLKLWYIDSKPVRTDLKSILLALIKDHPGIVSTEVQTKMGIQASNVRGLVLPLENQGKVFVEKGAGVNKLYLMEDKPVVDSKPLMSVFQAGANSLNVPVEKYEQLLDLELGPAIHDAEMRDFINSYYQGSNAKPLHMGGV